MLALLMCVAIASCKKESSAALQGRGAHLQKAGGYQFVFDLQGLRERNAMLRMMGLPPRPAARYSDHLSLTIVEAASGRQVDQAELTLTVLAPDGQSTAGDAYVMHGEGMHHWAYDFQRGPEGRYRAIAEFREGQRTAHVEQEFILE
ncbi:MAG: hypothetical protein K1X75_06635 [Leptospirales bacterium]|nr:hypothetical protein [Leptospirales bacterium]